LKIRNQLGIQYIGTGFLPNRAKVPLCLTEDRYVKLHKRLESSGTRGHEMMKGTASIHLHVVITCLDELLPLFYFLCELSGSDDFKMSPERKDIWQHTDSSRCGTPPCCYAQLRYPEELIYRLIQFAMTAEVLGEDVPFILSKDQSFESFLYHMTTLFTDVRFNLKGPTLELRTLDSMGTHQFVSVWEKFVTLLSSV